ncbi:hypothetical protein VTP01DRAFT_9488 [Rhizomucor pusillus]|uniref:uncharacterized protein n=1 Tax=Rhizomucor pusillus TaxID=4840 RepID=UPI0037435D85
MAYLDGVKSASQNLLCLPHKDQLREFWGSAQEAREDNQQWAKINGGFSVYTVRSSMSGEKSCQWHVVAMQNKHNHAFALNTASYRLEGEAQENVINMIRAHAENSTIVTYLKGLGITVVSKEVSNPRQKVFNDDPE